MTAVGVLAYTQVKIPQQETPDIAFLLWKDRRSTKTQSATYWGDLPCEWMRGDLSPFHTAARAFSQKTNGAFAPQSAGKFVNSVAACETMVLAKLKRGLGTLAVNTDSKIIYVLPVRLVALKQLIPDSAEHGVPQWVSASILLGAMESQGPAANLSVVVSHNATGHPLDSPLTLPLYLPFTTALRSQDGAVLAALKRVVGEFGKAEPEAQEVKEEVAASVTQSVETKDTALPSARFADCKDTFHCKACRLKLFGDKQVMGHEPASKRTSQFSKKDFFVQGADECSSIFLEQMLDGAPQNEGENEGKLLCPKCSARLGTFNWAGAQCSCGKWVCPAFQIVKSKVDLKSASAAPVAVYAFGENLAQSTA